MNSPPEPGSSSAATRPYGSPSPDELETRRGCIAIRETHARLESSLKFRGGASLNTHASFLRGFELWKKGYLVASVGGKQERGAPLSRSHLALRRFGVGGGNLRDGGKRHVRYPTASYDLVLGGRALALGDRPQRQPTICASESCHPRHRIADPSLSADSELRGLILSPLATNSEEIRPSNAWSVTLGGILSASMLPTSILTTLTLRFPISASHVPPLAWS